MRARILECKTITINYLAADGNNYEIKIRLPKEAEVPVDSELHVVEISELATDANGDKYADTAAEILNISEEDVKYLKLLDIYITKDGEKIQPKAPLSVEVTLLDKKDAIEEKEELGIQVVNIAEEESKEISSETEKDVTSFETESLEVYAFVGTLTTEFLSNDGTKYEVTVTYGPSANIPEGSRLSVTDIADGTDAYDYARNAVLADKKEKGENVNLDEFNLAALDISIIDPNGNEIEPEDSVWVDIRIKDLPGVENLDEIKETLEIQHHVEVTDGVVIEKVFDGSVEGSYKMDTAENVANAGTVVDPSSVSDEDFLNNDFEENVIDASFDTEVFSTFTITWRKQF